MGRDVKNCAWKSFAWVVLLLAFVFVGACAAEPQVRRVVRVGYPPAPGLSEVYSDGSRGGLVYEWLLEIAKYTGWEYEFIDEKDLNVMMQNMYGDKYDLLGGMLKVPDLTLMNERWFYPKYLMGSNDSILFYNKDDARIKNFDISTLNGKTIGVFAKAKGKIERLQMVLAVNQLNCNFKYYEANASFEQALKNREVDLLLASDAYNIDDYNIALRFPSDPFYMIAKKSNSALCQELDEAIEKIYSVNPNFGEQLLQKYFPEKYKNSTQFTAGELEFIHRSAPLKVAVVAQGNYPFYYSADGVAKGIVPEILRLLSLETGLQFQYVEAKSYTDALAMVEAGKADLLGNFINNNMPGSLERLMVTKNYVSLESIILRNKNVDLSEPGLSEAVVDGEALAFSPTDRRDAVQCRSYADCLRAVDTGKADYTVMPVVLLEYLYMQDSYANIIPVVDSSKLYLALAMRKDADINLYTVLTKAIVNLPDEKLQATVSGNALTNGLGKMSLKSLLYSNPVLSAVVIASFLGLLGVSLLMYLWLKLQNKIAYAKLKQQQEISKVRSEFLSRMSHEIRTPLNAIIGFINLMKLSPGDAADVQSNIAKIGSSAKFLLSLVNDILDMSKLENGKMQLENKPFAMPQLLAQLEDIFAAMTGEKQQALHFVYKLTHENFIGDAFRLKQILTNLLSNAYKFTPRGGEISVAVEELQSSGGNARLCFYVRDNGIGIPKEDQQRIFRSFEQVMGGCGVSRQGTGLGLAISYHLANLMDSELQIDSEAGQGSNFHFTVELPVYDGALEEAAESAAPDQQHALLRGKHILLVEDNELNAEIARELLQLQGVTVTWATNGQEAVEMFVATAEGAYDMILMDLQMPVKNGLEAAVEIRAMQRADAKVIPIIAMTANTLKEDQENAFAVGMNGFIPKPFDVEQLYKSVETFFH